MVPPWAIVGGLIAAGWAWSYLRRSAPRDGGRDPRGMDTGSGDLAPDPSISLTADDRRRLAAVDPLPIAVWRSMTPRRQGAWIVALAQQHGDDFTTAAEVMIDIPDREWVAAYGREVEEQRRMARQVAGFDPSAIESRSAGTGSASGSGSGSGSGFVDSFVRSLGGT